MYGRKFQTGKEPATTQQSRKRWSFRTFQAKSDREKKGSLKKTPLYRKSSRKEENVDGDILTITGSPLPRTRSLDVTAPKFLQLKDIETQSYTEPSRANAKEHFENITKRITGDTTDNSHDIMVFTAFKKRKTAKVGASVRREEEGKYHVTRVTSTGLFAESLMVGDEIEAINNVDCKEMSLKDIQDLVDGAEIMVTMRVRRKIQSNNVSSKNHTPPPPMQELPETTKVCSPRQVPSPSMAEEAQHITTTLDGMKLTQATEDQAPEPAQRSIASCSKDRNDGAAFNEKKPRRQEKKTRRRVARPLLYEDYNSNDESDYSTASTTSEDISALTMVTDIRKPDFARNMCLPLCL